jgi:RHS repeat-associated protein
MEQPGRTYNSPAYRYGFNGKEKDDEVSGSGNQYDYGFRIYNPRLGRFLSIDPLTKSYPMLTPYQFASNTPIQAIDLDGLEAANALEVFYAKTGDPQYTMVTDGTIMIQVNDESLSVTHSHINGAQIKLDLKLQGLGNKKGTLSEKKSMADIIGYANALKVYNVKDALIGEDDLLLNEFNKNLTGELGTSSVGDLGAGYGNTYRHLVMSSLLTLETDRAIALFAGDFNERTHIAKVGIDDDTVVDLINNGYGRHLDDALGIQRSDLNSKKGIADYLNKVVAYTINSFEELKNNPNLKDVASGKKKLFNRKSESVKSINKKIN